ncbi:ribosomal protein S18 acetylase RimI-like enzyme [Roseinatronobacter thiooxidans]|uniref:Ribosomal protein S18 acetylase RimI-like enzyme n=1 Tax=Roseinatronobacter thiooxidans TaxID=121821 RepID=A0A2W7QHE7_9RHOB|nr:GNAT family N-acetyltransferase [Roseinatronobacter thiooxidans]PZX47968.1 ribosomal protein S18 acetylase RimI-like enzyme [Roseinatronobacter thiooxidans]
MTLEIRTLRAEDKEEWAKLWTGYLEFYQSSLPQSVYDATFKALLSQDVHSPSGFLACLGGKPVGLVHFLFHAHCWRPEGICYLQDLYTSEQARGQGAGRALIEAVYAAADARNISGVYWTTQDFNTTARKLYDKIGVLTPFIKYARPQ